MSRTAIYKHPFLTRLGAVEAEIARSGPAWFRSRRQAAAERFESLDFPTTRLEEWRTTNVAPIAGTDFEPAPASAAVETPTLPTICRLELDGPRLTFVNGRFHAESSKTAEGPKGLFVGSLKDALERIPDRIRPHLGGVSGKESGAFESLNLALCEDGAVVLVPDGVELEEPIQIIFSSESNGAPTASAPRTLVVAGARSRVQLVESYCGGGQTYLSNAVTEVAVGDEASLTHYRLQFEGAKAFHVSTHNSRQGRNSRYVQHNIDLGGRLVRHDASAVLDGEGGWCQLNGLYLVGDDQHVDNHTVLDHARPHCDSRELYKGILDGRSRGVFNGRIIVRQDAQKTDAKQSNPNLLLSDKALATTRPQLEIYADDVKCTHGATIGRLDRDAIFYLRCRGLTHHEASNLLLGAFAGEVVEQIEIEPLRERLQHAVSERLVLGASPAESDP